MQHGTGFTNIRGKKPAGTNLGKHKILDECGRVAYQSVQNGLCNLRAKYEPERSVDARVAKFFTLCSRLATTVMYEY